MESKTLSNNKANITESMQVRKQAWPSYDEARLYSEEEEENCKHKGTMKVFISLSIISLITGIVFRCLASNLTSSIKDIDPSGDFTRISNPRCTITRVEFLKTKQLSNGSGAGSRNTGCEDTFQYYFTAEGLVNENDTYSKYEPFAEFASMEKVQRRESESCSDSVRLDPIYETGDVVDCWRPSAPQYVPSKWYRCGNDECMKIFAPQDDILRAESISDSYRTGSAIAFRVSIPFF